MDISDKEGVVNWFLSNGYDAHWFLMEASRYGLSSEVSHNL